MTVRYTPLPTVVTGDLWTAANHNTYIRDNFAVGASGLTSAKGTIVVGADFQDAVALPVGNNGDTLIADSSTPSGLAWTPVCGGASILNQGSQSIPVNIVTALAFPTLVRDSFGMFDDTNDLFTIPVGLGGFWLITLLGFMDGPSADSGKLLQIGYGVNTGPGTNPSYRWTSRTANADGKAVWLNMAVTLYITEGSQVWGTAYNLLASATAMNKARMTITKMR